VVPLAVVPPNVILDVTTASVYRLPAVGVPPLTVNAVPVAPPAEYGTTVNGPVNALLDKPVTVYDDVVWPVATDIPLLYTV